MHMIRPYTVKVFILLMNDYNIVVFFSYICFYYIIKTKHTLELWPSGFRTASFSETTLNKKISQSQYVVDNLESIIIVAYRSAKTKKIKTNP